MPSDCLFCRIIAGELPSTQVYADDAVVAIRDIAPQAPTHILLLSRRHIASLAHAQEGDLEVCSGFAAVGSKLAAQEGIADAGYRLVLNVGRHGGQTVDHLHVHLLGGRQMQWPPG